MNVHLTSGGSSLLAFSEIKIGRKETGTQHDGSFRPAAAAAAAASGADAEEMETMMGIDKPSEPAV